MRSLQKALQDSQDDRAELRDLADLIAQMSADRDLLQAEVIRLRENVALRRELTRFAAARHDLKRPPVGKVSLPRRVCAMVGRCYAAMMSAYSPIVSEFESEEQEASYDAWLSRKVEASLADDRPGVPHDEAMARVRAVIEAKAAQKRSCRVSMCRKTAVLSLEELAFASLVDIRPGRSI